MRAGVLALLFTVTLPAGAFAGWAAPMTLSDAGGDAVFSQLALDTKGNAIAAWSRFDGSNERVQAAVRPVGETFGAAQTLSDAGVAAYLDQLALDTKGNAIAAWSGFDGSNERVQAAVRPVGGTFGAAQTLSDAGGDADLVQLALDKRGNAIAWWTRFDGSNYRIQAAVFTR